MHNGGSSRCASTWTARQWLSRGLFRGLRRVEEPARCTHQKMSYIVGLFGHYDNSVVVNPKNEFQIVPVSFTWNIRDETIMPKMYISPASRQTYPMHQYTFSPTSRFIFHRHKTFVHFFYWPRDVSYGFVPFPSRPFLSRVSELKIFNKASNFAVYCALRQLWNLWQTFRDNKYNVD